MELKELEAEINELRIKLHEKEQELNLMKMALGSSDYSPTKLTNEEIARYSRQLVLPQIRVEGQLALKNASVLIVGAGGLGCPCALYLAGAGIGHIGIVDYDEVEVNNLHRQLLHTESNIGKHKVDSFAEALNRLNHNVKVTPYFTVLSSQNALGIVKQYDVVVDATDNVASRYLLNDSCVLSGKPLISGSALQWDGQLTVYNYKDGPCYRCIFPQPPPPETVINCGDGGVIGAVPGIIGILQALEVLKIILRMPEVLSSRWLVFDGSECTFRNFKFRDKNLDCKMCGKNPTIKKLIDYEQFCSARANDKDRKLNLLRDDERITPKEFRCLQNAKSSYILIDVRKPMEFDICSIPDSINIPLARLTKPSEVEGLKEMIFEEQLTNRQVSVFTVCRRGNDSQKAVKTLKNVLRDENVQVKDIIGGLHAWAKDVDPSFPVY